MSEVELVLNGRIFRVPRSTLHQSCPHFPTSPSPHQYNVTSRVSDTVFRTFVSALQGDPIEVTKLNFHGLSSLSTEFGFELTHPSYRLSQVEATVDALNTDIRRLSADVAALRCLPALAAHLSATVTHLRANVCVISEWTEVPNSLLLSASRTDPRIVPDFLDLFAAFRDRHFSILWRGTRDGFGASEFHRRCDGRANTLTVILDTGGNVFGGFTPVEWESRTSSPWEKADDSRRSFLFTLRNPHNVRPRKFELKAQEKGHAIDCSAGWGPRFKGGIAVSDNCSANSESYTFCFGSHYVNDTGLHGKTFFTGSRHFQVKEIEVFAIAE